jgi:hypothetical protein
MEMKYEKGRVSFNLYETLGQWTLEEKRELADALSCDTQVIEFVSQQIIDGMTELGSYGWTSPVSATPRSGLDRATREVAKCSGNVAKAEIERLERALKSAEEQNRKAWDEIVTLNDKLRGYR